MFEIMKPINVKKNKPHISAIHGHTIIELKNIKTGKRERVESDNVVTDAIEYYLNDANYAITTRYNGSIAPDLFGGIYLFDKQIPTSPMAKYMPAGTKMVGYGVYGKTNGGATTEMGSFDSVNSLIGKSEVTYVWDYTTAQANGSIKSICMGTQNGVAFGYGNSTSNVRNTDTQGYDAVSSSSIFCNDISSYLHYIVISGNCMYIPDISSYIPASGTRLNIKSKLIPTEEVDDFRFLSGFSVSYKTSAWLVLTSYWKTDFSIDFNAPGTDLYNVPILSFSEPVFGYAGFSGTTLKYYIFNVVDKTVTEKTLSLQHVTSGTHYSFASYLTPYKILYGWRTNSYPYKVVEAYIMDVNTGVSTRINGLTDFPLGNSSSSIQVFNYMNDVCFFRQNNDTAAGIVGQVLDLVNETVYPLNGQFSYGRRCKDEVNNIVWQTSSSANVIWADNDMMRLMTINNLSDTVVKTAADTMKVTYTLTME